MLKLILMRIGEDRGSAEGPPAGLARGLLGEEPTGTAVIAQIPPSINKVNYTPKDTSSYLPPNPSTCVKQEAWATPKEMSSLHATKNVPGLFAGHSPVSEAWTERKKKFLRHLPVQ